ncbi:MAG: hypothetical protein RL092_946 [Bacteroidota bacterium]|jgi:O-antigen/teichoic acid export membrane protein
MKIFQTNAYLKHVFTLMAGTVIGQGLVFLLSPFVFRLYTPEDFTALEQFLMLVTVLSVLVTGKYEFAIMHPRDDETARHILGLSLLIALVMSAFFGVISIVFSSSIASAMGSPSLKLMLWSLGPVLFFTAVANALNYWFSRKKNYKVAATAKVISAVGAEPVKIGVGLLNWGVFGLTWSNLIGNLFAAIFSLGKFLKDEVKGLSGLDRNELKQQAKNHRDYPLFSIWGSVLNRIAQWAHVGIFVIYYGPVGVAMMALCRRIVQAPLNVISNSYSQVFFQRISEIEDAVELKKLYYKVLFRFLTFGFILVLLIWLIPQNTMGFVFGEQWNESLIYLQWLSGWFALNFVSSSIAFITYRIQMQRLGTLLDALHFILAVAAIYVAHSLGLNQIEALKFFALSKVIYFALNLVVISWRVEKYVVQNKLHES